MNLGLGISLIAILAITNPAFAIQNSLNQIVTTASLYEADSLYQSEQSGDVEEISLSGEISSTSSVSYPLSINPGEKYFASFLSENTYTVNFTGKFKIRVYVPDPVPAVPSGCQTNPNIFKHATIVHRTRCDGAYGWNALAQYDWNRNAYGGNEKWWFILINKAVMWKRDVYGDYYPGNADFTWPCPAGQGNYYTNSALTRGMESSWFYIESGQYIRIVPGERRNVWVDNAGGITFEIVRPKEEKDEGANKKDPNTDQGHDPVNIINGNMYSTVQDLFIPGKGIPIEFSRAYNSQSIFNGPLGYGWTHNYNVLLTENPDGTITERDEDGTLTDFIFENVWEEGILDKIDISNGNVKLIKGFGFELTDLPQSSNVQSFWKFEEDSGIIDDETANNNDGIYNGILYRQSGKVGYALGFDGVDDYVLFNQPFILHQQTDATMGFWIKREATTHQSVFWTRRDSADYNRFNIYLDGALGFDYRSPTGALHPLISGIAIPQNVWTHLVIKRLCNKYYVYRNGIYVAEAIDLSPDLPTSTSWMISGRTGYIFKGAIDEVVVWNKALTVDEIASLYELKYPPSGKLNLKFDAGSTQSWQSYSFTGDESDGTNIKVRFRDSDTELGLETASWSQYYDTVTAPITDVPARQWFEIETTLESDTTRTYTPTLNRFIINHSGGSKAWESGYKAWDHSRIVKNPDSTYTLTRKHGTKYNFDSAGKLTSIIDRNNNQVTLGYTGELLTTITDVSGRAVALNYIDGKINQITDPANRTITYAYDANDNLIQVTDPAGNTTSYTYNTDHNLTLITDANGNHTYFAYDSDDRCIETKNDEDNRKFSFAYDPANSTTIMTNANNNQTTFVYDSEKGVVTSITDALGNVTTSIWDEDINRTSRIDANGNTTYFTYDDMGDVLTITDPLDNTTTFTYEAVYNLLTSITDSLNQVTQYAYDNNGNLLGVIDALNNVTEYSYDIFGNLIYLKDARGNITSYSYDSHGNLIEITDALSNKTLFTYDILGNVLTMTDARNNTTSYVYDELNRLTKIIYPDATSISYTYDAIGNRTSVTDPNNNITSYTYDVVNRLTQVRDALSNTTAYTYDRVGNRLSIADANSNATQYQYDVLNRLIKTITPLLKETTYQYDAVGNKISTIDANGITTTDIYDANNRLTRITYPDNSMVEFGYDATGKRINMADSTGTTIYTYDELNRLISVDGPAANDTISYTYDSVGNRTSMTDQDGRVTGYEYDKLNRLTRLIAPDGNITTYSYDAVSNLTKMLYPNSTEARYTFDNLNRLLTLANQGPSGVISSYAYEYNPAGMRTKVTLSDGHYIDYQYDATNRLIDETKKYSDESLDYFNRFTFDPVGNRTRLHRSTLRIEKDDFNRTAIIEEDWQTLTGWWLIENNRVRVHDARADAQLLYQKTISKNPTIEATVNVLNTGTKKVSGIIFSHINNNNFYYAGMHIHDGNNKGKGGSKNESAWSIGRYLNGGWLELAGLADEIKKNQDYNLKVIIKGEHVSLYVAGILKLETDISGVTQGKVGLCCEKNIVEFDDFKVTIGSEEYVDYIYNGENQLLSETITPKGENTPSRTYSYSYDNNGNLVQKVENGLATGYGYDYENRLTNIAYPDSTSSQYEYDGVGKRILTRENGTTINYLYDGLNAVIERNGIGETIVSYVRGLSYGGGIGSIISSKKIQDIRYHYYDGIGSITNLADENGLPVQSYIYDAYGNLLTPQAPIPYGYSTKEYSEKSNLIYFGARYYEPRVGRWMTKDPYSWAPDDARIYMNRWTLNDFIRNKFFFVTGKIDIQQFLDTSSINDALKNRISELGTRRPRYLHRYIYVWNDPVNFLDLYGLVPKPLPEALKAMADGALPFPVIGPIEAVGELIKVIPPGRKRRDALHEEFEKLKKQGVVEENPYEDTMITW